MVPENLNGVDFNRPNRDAWLFRCYGGGGDEMAQWTGFCQAFAARCGSGRPKLRFRPRPNRRVALFLCVDVNKAFRKRI